MNNTSENNTLRAKVAEILDDYNLVLNKGTNFGLKTGMVFHVYSWSCEIYDPDSGELLEKLLIPKGYGEITQVQSKIAILKSNQKKPSTLATITLSMYGKMESNLYPFQNPEIGDYVELVTPEDSTSKKTLVDKQES